MYKLLLTIVIVSLVATGCFLKKQPEVDRGAVIPLNQEETAERFSSKTENFDERVETEDIDTSDWKTYRNEVYGFELMFPGQEDVYISKDGMTDGAFDPGEFSFFLGEEENGLLIQSSVPLSVQESFSRILSENKNKVSNVVIDDSHVYFDSRDKVLIRLSGINGEEREFLVTKSMRIFIIGQNNNSIVGWYPKEEKYKKDFSKVYSEIVRTISFL